MSNLTLEQHLMKYWQVIDSHSIDNARMIFSRRINDNKKWLKYGLKPEDAAVIREDLRGIYRALSYCINRGR